MTGVCPPGPLLYTLKPLNQHVPRPFIHGSPASVSTCNTCSHMCRHPQNSKLFHAILKDGPRCSLGSAPRLTSLGSQTGRCAVGDSLLPFLTYTVYSDFRISLLGAFPGSECAFRASHVTENVFLCEMNLLRGLFFFACVCMLCVRVSSL